MNCCIFAGRLTKDCEVRHTQQGKSVGAYTLAIDDGYGDNKQTLFLDCVHWNCEKIAPYLTKGKALIVRGKLQQREYPDQNGQKRRVTELVVLESSFQQGGGNNSGGQHTQYRFRQQQSATPDQFGPSESPTGNDKCPF